MSHIYTEVRIPISWGMLAGKLWQPQYPSPPKKLGVLMLHGFLSNAASFDPLIEYFPNHLTLLAIDLAGHGFSDHYPVKNAYNYSSFISDAIEVLKYMSWEQTILVGHSFGGNVAINVAGILQNRISKLIVLEGAYQPENTIDTYSNYILEKYEDTKLTTERVYPSKAKVIERIIEGNPGIHQSSAEILATRACREENGGYVLTRDIGIHKPTLFLFRYCFWELFSQIFYNRITMPALFLIADESPYNGLDNRIERKNRISRTTRIVHVPGNHQVHMDNPSEVGRIIKEFLNEKIASKL